MSDPPQPGKPPHSPWPSPGPEGTTPPSAAPDTPPPPLVSHPKRFGAFLLEGILVVVTLSIGWLIWSLIIWRDGLTPAKQLLGMRCMKAHTDHPATWGTMALRELVGKWLIGNLTFGISTLVSAFMILLGEHRQGIWDLIATTVVIDQSRTR
jgi:uncharacterized RDD family membrane protein YckC